MPKPWVRGRALSVIDFGAGRSLSGLRRRKRERLPSTHVLGSLFDVDLGGGLRGSPLRE
jgi:hypothetical protein